MKFQGGFQKWLCFALQRKAAFKCKLNQTSPPLLKESLRGLDSPGLMPSIIMAIVLVRNKQQAVFVGHI